MAIDQSQTTRRYYGADLPCSAGPHPDPLADAGLVRGAPVDPRQCWVDCPNCGLTLNTEGWRHGDQFRCDYCPQMLLVTDPRKEAINDEPT